MATLTSYKGLDVVENATGAGGEAITEDFKILANRAPYPSISDPSATDDADAGFEIGALWFNTTTETMWVSVDSTNNSAVWKSLFKREATKLVLNPEADGAVAIDNLSIDGNTISATDANGDVVLDPDGLTGQMIVKTQREVTFTPTGGLSIQATTGGNTFMYGAKGSGGTNWGGFGLGGNTDTFDKYWIGREYNTADLVIDSAGNVGIGLLNPTNTLHVLGSVTIQDGTLLLDEVSAPSDPPAGTAVLFLESQSLKIKFANGTTKTIANNT